MLLLRVRVNLGAMPMNVSSAFLKAQALLELPIRLFAVVNRTFVGEVLPLYRVAVRIFYSTSRLDLFFSGEWHFHM